MLIYVHRLFSRRIPYAVSGSAPLQTWTIPGGQYRDLGSHIGLSCRMHNIRWAFHSEDTAGRV